MSSSKHVGGKARLLLLRIQKKKLFSGDQLQSWLIVHTILDSCSTAVQSRKNTQQIRSRTGLHNTTKDTAGSATLHRSTSEPFSYLTVKSVDFRAWEQNPCRPGHDDSDVTQQVHCEKLQVRFTLVSRNKTKKEGSSDGWTLDFLLTPCWRSDKQRPNFGEWITKLLYENVLQSNIRIPGKHFSKLLTLYLKKTKKNNNSSWTIKVINMRTNY